MKKPKTNPPTNSFLFHSITPVINEQEQRREIGVYADQTNEGESVYGWHFADDPESGKGFSAPCLDDALEAALRIIKRLHEVGHGDDPGDLFDGFMVDLTGRKFGTVTVIGAVQTVENTN